MHKDAVTVPYCLDTCRESGIIRKNRNDREKKITLNKKRNIENRKDVSTCRRRKIF